MGLHLVLYATDATGRHEVTRLEDGLVTIGRDDDNVVIIDNVSVSRRHGFIAKAGTQWIYCDLSSTNGSFHNNRPVQSKRHLLLRDGDKLTLANFELQIEISEEADGSPNPPARSLLLFRGVDFEQEISLDDNQRIIALVTSPKGFLLSGTIRSNEECVIQLSNAGVQLDLLQRPRHQLLVNGEQVTQGTLLKDRASIVSGDMTLLVNSSRSSIIESSKSSLPSHISGKGERSGLFGGDTDSSGFEPNRVPKSSTSSMLSAQADTSFASRNIFGKSPREAVAEDAEDASHVSTLRSDSAKPSFAGQGWGGAPASMRAQMQHEKTIKILIAHGAFVLTAECVLFYVL